MSNSKDFSQDFHSFLNNSNDSFSTDRDESLIAQQNKFNAVKRKFVEERNERQSKEKELQGYQKKAEILKIELNEKVVLNPNNRKNQT